MNLESFFLKDKVCNPLPKKSPVYLVALKLIKEWIISDLVMINLILQEFIGTIPL